MFSWKLGIVMNFDYDFHHGHIEDMETKEKIFFHADKGMEVGIGRTSEPRLVEPEVGHYVREPKLREEIFFVWKRKKVILWCYAKEYERAARMISQRPLYRVMCSRFKQGPIEQWSGYFPQDCPRTVYDPKGNLEDLYFPVWWEMKMKDKDWQKCQYPLR